MSKLFDFPDSAILISVHPEHLERIFSGQKRYELRKALPNQIIGRVYFYETLGGGIVGYARVSKIIKAPPASLWEKVGELSTTRERFFSYFKNKKIGYAIELESPVRFSAPLLPPILREYLYRFTPPQSFIFIGEDHPLHKTLSNTEPTGQENQIQLMRISKDQESSFTNLIKKEVGPRYDDTEVEYSSFLLDIQKEIIDPNGFLTVGKEVLSIYNKNKHVGYSVLTYKRGRSVKSGPTILFDEYRNIGLGPQVRQALEERALMYGASKLYCTCPAVNSPIVSLLLKTGYKIEGHLSNHYKEFGDELVWGKLLKDDGFSFSNPKRNVSSSARVVLDSASPTRQNANQLVELLAYAGLGVPPATALNLIKNTSVEGKSIEYSKKPRTLIWLLSGDKKVGVALLAFKRGGAVRIVLGVKTQHSPSLERLIQSCIQMAIDYGRRKLYFMHPVDDSYVVSSLYQLGFVSEALLRSPYENGRDVVILSKWLL